MKEKLYVVDLLAEKGHLLFVSRTIEILELNYDIVLISSKKYCEEIGSKKYIALDNHIFESNNRYEFVIGQIKLIKKTLKLLKPKDKVIVTSFENISFSFAWNRAAYAFVHNNLDKKGLSYFFLKRINQKTVLLVFEEYMISNLKNELKQELVHIPHPMNFKINDGRVDDLKAKERYIFAINIDNENDDFKKLVEFCILNSIKIYLKSRSFEITTETIVSKKYYSNYREMMANAHFVVLDLAYNYRVSGVFYECMVLNKKVLFLPTQGLFPVQMKKKYPKNCFIEQLPNSILKAKPNNNLFLIEHNDSDILKRFKGKLR